MNQHSRSFLPVSTFQFKALLLLGIGILLIGVQLNAGPPEGFSPLFDGKTFKGWEGNKDYFRIEEGAIVAGNLKKRIPKNQFLVTKKEYKDFELRFEARFIGQGNNAGVQFWSQRILNHHEMIGFQCDIGGWSKGAIWGFLYDESRRRRMLAEAPQDELARHIKPKGEWNKLRVHAKGNLIQIWLNEFQTVNYTEKEPSKKIPRDGRFGLQIHSGPPAECWYRNIWLKEL
jgi:hypothetical protein